MRVEFNNEVDIRLNFIEEYSNYISALNAFAVVSIVSSSGKFIRVNDAFCEVLGYSVDDVLGKSYNLLLDDAVDDIFLNNQWRGEDIKSFWKGELSNIGKNGDVLWFETVIVPFRNSKNELYQYAIVQLDVTSKVSQIYDLEDKNYLLEKDILNLNRVLCNFSHDLRSPLMSILGLTMYVDDSTSKDVILEYLGLIKESVLELDNYIKNMLDFSRNSRSHLTIKKISLHKCVLSIVDLFKNIKEANEIRFYVDVKESESFYTDKLIFKSILKNLISNAIKYHSNKVSQSYIKIAICFHGEQLKIDIEDNGVGIPSVYHDTVFDMFFRSPTTTIGEGHGLGLFIVKEAVEILGGKIHLKSEEGVGSTFTVLLNNQKSLNV